MKIMQIIQKRPLSFIFCLIFFLSGCFTLYAFKAKTSDQQVVIVEYCKGNGILNPPYLETIQADGKYEKTSMNPFFENESNLPNLLKLSAAFAKLNSAGYKLITPVSYADGKYIDYIFEKE